MTPVTSQFYKKEALFVPIFEPGVRLTLMTIKNPSRPPLPHDLSQQSPIPKYKRLAKNLEEKFISPGAAHDILPTERELQKNYGVSRDTVRRALALLAQRGLIYNIQGSGSYIADRGTIRKVPRLTSFTEDMTMRGSKPASTTISCVMIAAPINIARDLAIEPGAQVLRIIRLRKADGAPMAYERAHFLPQSFAHVEPKPSGSLDEQLARNGYRIMTAEQRISATNLTAEEARALAVPTNTAALKVERLGFTEYGLAVESTQTFYRADRYDYVLKINREGQI